LIHMPASRQTRRGRAVGSMAPANPAWAPDQARPCAGGGSRSKRSNVDAFQRRWPVTVAWRNGGRAARIGLILAILGVATVGVAPATLAADPIALTTPYPAVAVAPGAKVTFNLSVKTPTSARVGLSLSTIPTGWTAVLRGGGFVVDGVQTNGTDAAEVVLDVSVPADAAAETQRITVTGTGAGSTTTLPL